MDFRLSSRRAAHPPAGPVWAEFERKIDALDDIFHSLTHAFASSFHRPPAVRLPDLFVFTTRRFLILTLVSRNT